MSLDKAVQHGKEKQIPYRKSKAVDPSCRNHRPCPWCQRNRTIQTTRAPRKANGSDEE